jgi:uncharacterized delta-60 repeat protein
MPNTPLLISNCISINKVEYQPSTGNIILAGCPKRYRGLTINNITRLTCSGTTDSSFLGGSRFGTSISVSVDSMKISSSSQILLGGEFTTYNGTARNRILRLTANGILDGIFNPGTGFPTGINGVTKINSIDINPVDNTIIVAGYFESFNGFNLKSIVKLSSVGTRVALFSPGTNPGFSGPIGNHGINSAVFQSDGKVVVGGNNLTSYFNGFAITTAISNFARITTTGQYDATFNIGIGFIGEVRVIKIQPDGKILVGGDFTSYNSVPANRIIRLNSDGTIDTSFDYIFGFNGPVNDILLESDGSMIVIGNFTTYNGVNAPKIIKLNSDGGTSSSFNTNVGNGFDNYLDIVGALLPGNELFLGQSDIRDYNYKPIISFTKIKNSGIISCNPLPSRCCSADGGITSGFFPCNACADIGLTEAPTGCQ